MSTTYAITKGDTGTLLDLTVGDRNGPLNIAGFTVLFRYAAAGVVTEKAVTPDVDQTTNEGRATAYWGATELNSVPDGTYPCQVKTIGPDGKIRYFPTHGFGSLVVRSPL